MKLTSFSPGAKKYSCIYYNVVRQSNHTKSFRTCVEMLDFACGLNDLYIASCSDSVRDWAVDLNHGILRSKSWEFA